MLSFVPISDQRLKLARHLSGNGVEIGALHRPLQPLPKSVNSVSYIDRKSTEELRVRYTELANFKLVNVDIIGIAENLDLEAQSQDFIIANHLIEHTEGTFQTLENFARILKPEGILYMAVPDRRFTFDRHREAVTYEHLLNEYYEGFEESRQEHYMDWIENVEIKFHKKTLNKEEINGRMQNYLQSERNIHFHTWNCEEFLEHMFRMKHELKIPLNVIDIGIRKKPNKEFIVVLQKTQ